MVYYSIAIDGPSASGKSTVAKAIAKKLNFTYINSGSYYRILAYLLSKKGISYSADPKFIVAVAEAFNWDFTKDGVCINGVIMNAALKTNHISDIASKFASIPEVRDLVNRKIKQVSENLSIVMDGRDIGTIVLPNATLKIYLTASINTRALRRYKELKLASLVADLRIITNNLIERDNKDITRDIAPLAQAKEAVYIDNSNMSFDETVDEIVQQYMKSVIGVSWVPIDEL